MSKINLTATIALKPGYYARVAFRAPWVKGATMGERILAERMVAAAAYRLAAEVEMAPGEAPSPWAVTVEPRDGFVTLELQAGADEELALETLRNGLAAIGIKASKATKG